MFDENKEGRSPADEQPLLDSMHKGWSGWGRIKDMLPGYTPKQVVKWIGGFEKNGVTDSLLKATYKAANDVYTTANWIIHGTPEAVSPLQHDELEAAGLKSSSSEQKNEVNEEKIALGGDISENIDAGINDN